MTAATAKKEEVEKTEPGEKKWVKGKNLTAKRLGLWSGEILDPFRRSGDVFHPKLKQPKNKRPTLGYR